jgi:hypothetical protein
MGKWRRFLEFTAAERGIVPWALVSVPMTRTALRILSYRHRQDLLFLAVRPASGSEVRPERISEAATERLRRGRCLETICRVVLASPTTEPPLRIRRRRPQHRRRFRSACVGGDRITVMNDGGEVRKDNAPFDQDNAAACKGAR